MYEHDPNLDPEPIQADAGQPPTAGEAPADSQDAPLQDQASVHEDALAIAELCLLAGTPERTAEFLAQGLNAQQVRRTLLDARAMQPEIASRITPEAARRLLDEGNAALFDVRSAEEYTQAHAEEAFHYPLSEAAQLVSALPGDGAIIFY